MKQKITGLYNYFIYRNIRIKEKNIKAIEKLKMDCEHEYLYEYYRIKGQYKKSVDRLIVAIILLIIVSICLIVMYAISCFITYIHFSINSFTHHVILDDFYSKYLELLPTIEKVSLLIFIIFLSFVIIGIRTRRNNYQKLLVIEYILIDEGVL